MAHTEKIKGKWYQAENTRVIIRQEETLPYVKGWTAAQAAELSEVNKICVAVNNFDEMKRTIEALLGNSELNPLDPTRVWQRDTPSTKAIVNAFALLRRIEEEKGK